MSTLLRWSTDVLAATDQDRPVLSDAVALPVIAVDVAGVQDTSARRHVVGTSVTATSMTGTSAPFRTRNAAQGPCPRGAPV